MPAFNLYLPEDRREALVAVAEQMARDGEIPREKDGTVSLSAALWKLVQQKAEQQQKKGGKK
jgi:hypothetical protein